MGFGLSMMLNKRGVSLRFLWRVKQGFLTVALAILVYEFHTFITTIVFIPVDDSFIFILIKVMMSREFIAIFIWILIDYDHWTALIRLLLDVADIRMIDRKGQVISLVDHRLSKGINSNVLMWNAERSWVMKLSGFHTSALIGVLIYKLRVFLRRMLYCHVWFYLYDLILLILWRVGSVGRM